MKYKEVAATLDYGLTWQDWLGVGEEIVSSAWEADGVTLANDSFTANETVVYVSGGNFGETYSLKNTITTNAALTRTAVRFLDIEIVARTS